MEVTQRLDELEGELKIIKNEVQSVLLDVREHVLSYNKNPFQMINFRPPTPKEEANEEDEKPGGRRERDAGGVVVPSGAEGADPGGGTDMANQEVNNKLKALMDQLERDRQSLKDEKQELAQQAAASAPQPASGSPPPGQGGQYNPGYQPSSQQYPQQPQPGQGYPQQPMYPPSQPGQGFSPPAQQFPSQPSRPSAAGQQPARSSQISRRFQADNSPQSAAEQANRFRKRFSGEFSGMEEEERGLEGKKRMSGSARSVQAARQDESDEGEVNRSQVNLLTLVGLVRWVEKSMKRIGKEKLESIVEIYQTAGYLPTTQKDVIAQIMRLADGEKPEGPVTMGVSIQVLLELDSLMGGKFQTESSILSTLFTEDGGYPWTKQ